MGHKPPVAPPPPPRRPLSKPTFEYYDQPLSNMLKQVPAGKYKELMSKSYLFEEEWDEAERLLKFNQSYGD